MIVVEFSSSNGHTFVVCSHMTRQNESFDLWTSEGIVPLTCTVCCFFHPPNLCVYFIYIRTCTPICRMYFSMHSTSHTCLSSTRKNNKKVEKFQQGDSLLSSSALWCVILFPSKTFEKGHWVFIVYFVVLVKLHLVFQSKAAVALISQFLFFCVEELL